MSLSKSIHVLLIPSWYPANRSDIAGSFFREQAQALRDMGMKVGVIAPRSVSLREPSKWFTSNRAVDVVDDEGVLTVRSTAVEWFGRIPWLGPRVWVRRGMKLFRRYVQENGTPDVLHAHSLLNGGLLAQEIASRERLPYVVTEHRSSYKRAIVPGWKLRAAKSAAFDASTRIAVSRAFSDFLNELMGAESGPWRYIPNIVHERFFAGPLAKPPGFGKRFQFCNVGMMTPIKGQSALIYAFAEAFQHQSNVILVIAGDGPLRDSLVALASDLGVDDRIRFPGRLTRDEIEELLRESSAYISTSLSETFGVALAEALAMGLPVVATKSGGPESILEEGDGILVSNGDHRALVAAMRRMFESHASYSPNTIRQRCARRFSGRAVATQLIDVYGGSIASKAKL